MASTVIDSELLGGNFGDDRFRAVFSDEALVADLLRTEAALARAEARLGIIPAAAAEEIVAKCDPALYPLEQLRRGMEATGHVLVPLLRQLTAACAGDAGGYVHWGATTQDIVDTANMLRNKRAVALLVADLRAITATLAELAGREADTVIAGRTHGQHALPTTFGYKAAVWAWEMKRQVERWEQAAPRCLVGNLTGAVGSFAGFGERGPEVQRLALEELGLGVPEICWHTARDRSAEIAALLTLTAGTLEKIAGEIYRLQTTEYGEVEEPFFEGKVGSSTMPHKRNPSLCEAVLTACKAARAEASMVFEVMAQEHERQSSFWKTEWVGLPNAFILVGGAASKLIAVLKGLNVRRDRMARNLGLSHGLMLSEAVMLRLGRFVGRERAHQIVYQASMRAFEEDRPLGECLKEVPEVMAHLSEAELDRLLDARSYVGQAPVLARRAAEALGRAGTGGGDG